MSKKENINTLSKVKKDGKKSGNVFKVDGKFDFIALVKNIFLVFVGAATVGFLNKDSFKMYKILEKPWFAPPAVAFPIVWTILYILMALAAYRIYMKNRSGIKDGGAYFYYPPSMPWHRTDSEPDTLDEVHKRIIKAVQVITDLTDEEIEQMIDDDLYVVGIG